MASVAPVVVLAVVVLAVPIALETAQPACAEPSLQVQSSPGPARPTVGEAVTLFLVGDAGDPEPEGEPVLQALSRQVEGAPGRVVVAILGDNIYPMGLPAPSAADRPRMERRLRAQLDAARVGNAEVIVLPGNHDWEKGRRGGWEAVRRQQRFVDENYGDRVRWLPRDGCPGPIVVDEGPLLRLIVLDTQWFLHSGPRPYGSDSGCAAATPEEAMSQLSEALATAGGRQVVLLAHHPLLSAGRHGGFFAWQDHVFPLRNLRPWIWLPLPVVGSLYPISRQLGISSQDQSNGVYRQLVQGLVGAFGDRPPLLYAAGHEHNLEVLGGDSRPWVVVSGAGRFGEATPLGGRPDAVFLSEEAGFARVDFGASGRVWLRIESVDRAARSTTAFAIDLETAAGLMPAMAVEPGASAEPGPRAESGLLGPEFVQPGGREVAVEGERAASSQAAHEREAGGVDERVGALVVTPQPAQGLLLLMGLDRHGTQAGRALERVEELDGGRGRRCSRT